jgi:arylesterase/paraoxonase
MRRAAAGLLIVLALLAALVFHALVKARAFARTEPHFTGACEPLPLPGSAEDIQIDRETGLAYLSVLDRNAVRKGGDATGTVLAVDLDAETLAVVEAVTGAPADFRPHGMSLYTAPDGSQRLFVISHPQGKPHTVEVFERGADGLFEHLETLHNPLLFAPNAIVAVGPRQFYVANFSGASPGIERFIEMYFGRALAEIVYFDGDVMRAVDAPIALGTGIAASADGGRVYVSEANAQRLRIYSRDSETGDLVLVEYVDIHTVPDNLNVAEDGAIWIAAHPKPYQLLKHLQDPARQSATQVLRVASDPQAENRIQEIYLNAGDEISAGSVGAVSGKQLLIGSITEHKILVCNLP